MLEINGASPEQEQALREILSGMPGTRIQRLRLEPDRERAPGTVLTLVEPHDRDIRTSWEGHLVAQAFCDVSHERGLPAVVSFAEPRMEESLDPRGDASPPANRSLRDQLSRKVELAAHRTGAALERLEVLQPRGLAPAVALAIPDAHAFLRHGFEAFLELIGHFGEQLEGSFVEVLDGEVEPVLATARYGGSGMGTSRPDVQCCHPFISFGGIEHPDPPPCPRLRAFDDLVEAFRRNLSATTGRDLADWLSLLDAEGPPSAGERYEWLQRTHGLGPMQAGSIVWGPSTPA